MHQLLLGGRRSARRAALLLAFAGCSFACRATGGGPRAVPVPAAATRTLDLALPLSEPGPAFILFQARGVPPPDGTWEGLLPEEIAEMLATVPPSTRTAFAPILAELALGPIADADLDAGGRIGSLFSPPGALESALDARFAGGLQPLDLRAGIFEAPETPALFFVFYRRFPVLERRGDRIVAADVPCDARSFCRLVVFGVATTRSFAP